MRRRACARGYVFRWEWLNGFITFKPNYEVSVSLFDIYTLYMRIFPSINY